MKMHFRIQSDIIMAIVCEEAAAHFIEQNINLTYQYLYLERENARKEAEIARNDVEIAKLKEMGTDLFSEIFPLDPSTSNQNPKKRPRSAIDY